MKEISIPIMIQDPRIAQLPGVPPAEGSYPQRDFYLDGPVTARIAVLDFDPETGKVKRGARFNPGQKRGWYEGETGQRLTAPKQNDPALYTDEFKQVSVFATVLKTMDLVEKADTLGRALTWAFDGPQLLVIPQAGEQANAYYHRDSHSLQFFFFRSPSRQETVYTCLSRDIVAHETGHAIVDGIAPDLLDAYTPQSLAIHEAIADLTAMLLAYLSGKLTHYWLDNDNGSIPQKNPFTTIAEEYGTARGHKDGLRDLFNNKTLDPNDKSRDKNGRANYVKRQEDPHDLSEVLSGALCKVMIQIHEDQKRQLAEKVPEDLEGRLANKEITEAELPEKTEDAIRESWGRALGRASRRLKRMVFRALDYLPPGEVSFADYGRALIAVDQAAYPNDPQMRHWVCEEFARRHMIQSKAALVVETDYECEELKGVDVRALCSSDWAAYQFANANRDLLGIPKQIPFEVRPRLTVLKRYDGDAKDKPSGHECIFKVAWNVQEDNQDGLRLPEKRQITVGTTLVIQPHTGRVVCRLTTAPPPKRPAEGEDRQNRRLRLAEYREQRGDRDSFLRSLVESGDLKLGQHALAPDGEPLLSVVRAEVSGGVMHLRGSGNMLHIARGGNDE